MMFMMPMPPTSRAMETMPPATAVMVPVMPLMMPVICFGLNTLKPLGSAPRRPLMRRMASSTSSAPSSALRRGSTRAWKKSWRRWASVSWAMPVVRGMRMFWSGSLPSWAPCSSRTPMTSRLRVGVLMRRPRGLPLRPSFSMTRGPMMATLLPRRRSEGTKLRPATRLMLFSSR